MPDLSFEDLIDESLVGGSDILQTEGHHFVTAKALGDHEGRMLFVLGRHPDLVISGKDIHEAEQSMIGRRIYELVDLRQWEAILQAGSIQVGIVDTDLSLSVGFLHHDDIGETVRIYGFSDEARLE